MKQKNNFEGKDWAKAAKAFARQAYGKELATKKLLERKRGGEPITWDE